jgi:hypothetical protein
MSDISNFVKIFHFRGSLLTLSKNIICMCFFVKLRSEKECVVVNKKVYYKNDEHQCIFKEKHAYTRMCAWACMI